MKKTLRHFAQWLISFVCVCIIVAFLSVFLVRTIVWQQKVQKEAFVNLHITEQWTYNFWKNYGGYLREGR